MRNSQPIASRWRFMVAKALAKALPGRTYYYFDVEGCGGGGTIGQAPPRLHHATRAAHYECRLPGVRLVWRVTGGLPNAA